jgi:hypothetical protein
MSDPPELPQSEAAYRESLFLAEGLGARPLCARCHLGLGRLRRREGKHDHAKRHLTVAETMLREMGMQYWLDEVHEELKHLR